MVETQKVAIKSYASESTADKQRYALLGTGVRQAWTEYCELTGMWHICVSPEDARGAYVRLCRLETA
jgi:hypothetical protein